MERLPSDAMEQSCSGTTEKQVLISIVSDAASKSRLVVYRAPATLGEIVRNEHLTSPVTVLLRTCKDQVGRLIEHPTPDMQLHFGSTLLVKSTSKARRNGKDKSGSDEEDVL